MERILTLQERRALKSKFDLWHKKRVETATNKYDLDYYELVEEVIDAIVQMNDENYDNYLRVHNEKMKLINENHLLKIELQQYRDNEMKYGSTIERNRARDSFFNPSIRLPKHYRQ